MLTEPTREKLALLRLTAMADAWDSSDATPQLRTALR